MRHQADFKSNRMADILNQSGQRAQSEDDWDDWFGHNWSSGTSSLQIELDPGLSYLGNGLVAVSGVEKAAAAPVIGAKNPASPEGETGLEGGGQAREGLWSVVRFHPGALPHSRFLSPGSVSAACSCCSS